MNQQSNPGNLWQQYVVLLGQLKELVQSQNELLRERQWEAMAQIYARKETNILALQKVWRKIAEKQQDKLHYSPEAIDFRDKARSIILMIREIEKHNERMILEAMQNTKGQIGDLKDSKRKLIQYLESGRSRKDPNINRVT